jgi:hypothetical protein
MVRLVSSIAVVLTLAGVAQASAPRAGEHSAAAQRKPILATTTMGLTPRLFLADPVSLRARAGRSLAVEFTWTDFSRSPDGSLLVLSQQSRGYSAELRFIRVGAMRFTGTMRFSAQYVRALGWFSSRRLLAVVDSSLLGIDVTTRKVVWQRPLAGTVLAAARRSNRLVLLVAPDAMGSATVLAVDANGSVKSVAVDRVLAGFGHESSSPGSIGTMREPGLAVDPVGNRAYVVGAGEPIAQVDLSAMNVAYQGGSRTFAKVIPGPQRQAIWLGNGMLAVTGTDRSMSTDAIGQLHETIKPSGLYIVDTRTGSARLLQADAAAASVVGRSLLAYGTGFDSASAGPTGSGVTVYSLDGTPRLHLFGRTPVSDVKTQSGLAYVTLPDRSGHIVVLDVDAGRVLATVTKPTLTLFARH